MWSWLQDLTTSLRAVLATQRVLQGVGVGSGTATALSAAQHFLVRDAAGMLATLLFTAAAAARLTRDVKRWRLLADVLVDVGITLEVAAVQLPTAWFVPLLCVASMCKAICGVAAGACGGSIAVYWAARERTDISDIHAKFGAQHTVTGALGLVLAGVFAQSVATCPLRVVWALYSVLTALHIGANMRCMRLLAFPTFNTARLNMVLQKWLKDWNQAEPMTKPLPTPREIARREPLFFLLPSIHRSAARAGSSVPIHFGVSFNEFVERSGKDPTWLMLTSNGTQQPPYWISTGRRRRQQSQTNNRQRPCVVVAFSEHCTAEQKTQAYLHAALLGCAVEEIQRVKRQKQEAAAAADGGNGGTTARNSHELLLTDVDLRVAEEVAMEDMPAAWEVFANQSRKAGWDLTKSELQGQGYEIVLQQQS